MSLPVYIISDAKLKVIVDRIRANTFINQSFESPNSELTSDILISIAEACPIEYFYVISTDVELFFPNFDFSFKPKEWDSKYIHIWNNDTKVRLFNKKAVLENPNKFTDGALLAGAIELKNIDKIIWEYPLRDIIFLSYDEIYADDNYQRLKKRFPRVNRIKNIKGIFEAHKAAAKLATTEMFYVVDADADIVPDFNFDYQPLIYDMNSVHVWHSHNPVNDLEYGYGGIKLFPTKMLLEYNGSPVDFTTSVSKSFKVIPKVSNITRFNTDPFSTWRSAFRECTKLASKLITNQDNTETEERLHIWCTKGIDREYGEFAIMGANEGMEFGKKNIDQPDMLKLINDFNWLENKFNS